MRRRKELLLIAAALVTVAGLLLWTALAPPQLEPESAKVVSVGDVHGLAADSPQAEEARRAASDGQTVFPFAAAESSDGAGLPDAATDTAEPPGQTGPPPQTAPPKQTAPQAPKASYPVNVNSAGLDALQTLPGIGPVKAQAILDYRTAYGPFGSVDDLTNVKGIGQKTLEKLLPYITV
ncbi:MAG: helix-hairpin-helix domain-containing protein [Oscillospiraceae bacterium]|jgi:competence protein ComEA|nr:helix-hairpin-helix domain-containing protein [Oscillospiraceae bacterium]